MKELELFGVSVALGTREELLGDALALLDTGGTIATVNASMLEYARVHHDFCELLQGMSLRIPDGRGMARALSRRGEKTDTLPGVELGLLLLVSRPYLRVALYGGKAGVAERTRDAILNLSPTTDIVYVRDGYHYTPFEIARDLAKMKVDLVFVCLGSPRQERVAKMLAQVLPHALIIGLGGSFDVWCGDTPRAPVKWQQKGMEWLWRILKEPKRIAKLPTLLSFSYHILLDELQQNSQKTRKKAEAEKNNQQI
ncbi:MAG: WecB/TagA/CpsF family glycosyltransferase [Clostridia bacterium]|nr:WecB/TagA/CpsF family glycosyltransferase [Clostridia bacterium]